jgi:hypothetical protein
MADNLRFVVRALEGFAAEKVKRITLDARSELVKDTPRETSWARNNWVPHIGTPLEEPAGTREQAEAGNIGPAIAASEAGAADVATNYTLDRGKVYISNNVPYIERLNQGSSQQAPKDFVQTAILRAVRLNG